MSLLTIKARMYVNLGVLAVAMLIVCGVALSAFNSSSRRMQQLHAENLVPITQINEIYQRSLQSQQYRLEAYIHRDPAFTQRNYDAIKQNRARINERNRLAAAFLARHGRQAARHHDRGQRQRRRSGSGRAEAVARQ